MPEKEEMPFFKQLLGKTVYDIKQKAVPWQLPDIIVPLRISANISWLPCSCLQKQERCNTSAAACLQDCRKAGDNPELPCFALCNGERLLYKDLVSLNIYLKSLLFLFLIKLLGFGL